MDKIKKFTGDKNYVILLLHENKIIIDSLQDIIDFYKNKNYIFKKL